MANLAPKTCLGGGSPSKPAYLDKLIRSGAMEVTKPCEFIGCGAMDITKPYDFCLGFWGMDVTCLCPDEKLCPTCTSRRPKHFRPDFGTVTVVLL